MTGTETMLANTQRLCRSYCNETVKLRQAVLKQWKLDDIHDLRVGSRRLRAVLDLLRPLCDGKRVRRGSKDARRLTDALGQLRNLDEAQLFISSHAGQDTQVLDSLKRMRSEEQSRVREALKAFSTGRIEKAVDTIADHLECKSCSRWKARTFPGYLAEVSLELFEKVQELLPLALQRENREQRHRLRITVKKWRYFLEVAAVVLEADLEAPLARLRRYQSLLGSMNDIAVFEELLRQVLAKQTNGGGVEQVLAREDQQLFQRFQALAEAEPIAPYLG